MKIATTIGEVYGYVDFNPERALTMYEGTGFRHFDYSFYGVVKRENDPFLSDGWRSLIEGAIRTADKLGVDFVQAHAPAGKIFGEGSERCLFATQRSIEACGMLGIKNMVIHTAFSPDIRYSDGRDEYFEKNRPFFESLIPAMEKHGVRILFENTSLNMVKGAYFPVVANDLNDFIEYMGHPLFGACWDVGHANIDMLDHCAEIKRLGKNLKAIHVHDNDGIKDRHYAPFVGNMDFDSLMRGLIESGYDGYFTLESDGFFKKERTDMRTTPEKRLISPSYEVKKASLTLLYQIAKQILTEYGVYED